MIDIKVSDKGVFTIDSITMGTPLKVAIKDINKLGLEHKEDKDYLKIQFTDSIFSQDYQCDIWYNINDTNEVCDFFAIYDKLSYEEAELIQSLYVKKVDRLPLEKKERGKKERGEVLYSYSNNLFKLDISRFREGGESANIPTGSQDYIVSLMLTSYVEEIKCISDIKSFVYRGNCKLAGNKEPESCNKLLWSFTAVNSILIICMGIFLLYSGNGVESQKISSGKNMIGEYVYIDNADVLHTKNRCKAVLKVRSMQAVTPYKIEELKRDQLKKICSQCVSEEQLDTLRWFVEYTNDGYDIDKDILD